jgi:hypothetical protein
LSDGGFWSELDLGVLDQATGQSTLLGAIVRPALSFAQAESNGISVDIGVSSLSELGGYLYVYFPDITLTSSGILQATGLSAARAPLSDVLAAAENGTVTQWWKYGAGGWTVPSLGGGGLAADLNPGEALAQHPDVVRSSALGTSIMVGGVSANEMDLTSSADGIHWSSRVPLFREPGDFDAYPTLVGEGTNPADPEASFYLYYTQWPGTRNWSDAHLMRREITCTSGLPAATIPFVRYYNGTRHEVTTGPADPGYTEEGHWYLLSTEQPGTTPLYGCRNGDLLVDQFVSRDPDCESPNNAITQTEGWIYTAPPPVPYTPLYRCHIPGLGDHFVSILASCEAPGIVNEGLLGYAPMTG